MTKTTEQLIEAAAQSATIQSEEVAALRRLIEADAYAAQPGAAAQKSAYDEADYQDWWPSTSDRRFGAMARAEAQSTADWAFAVERLADAPAYASAVEAHGRDAVREMIADWCAGPETSDRRIREAAHSAATRAADEADGAVGSLADLNRMFPEHVRAQEWYSESGDGGWAGGGPDSWASGTDYVPLTDPGRIAIEAVKGGARPRPAMDAAIAAETARLTAEGKAKAEAEAMARADREAQEALDRAQRQACIAIRDAARLPDTRGRCPGTRRASETRLADMAAGEAALAAVLAIECPTALASEVQAEAAAELREYIAGRKAAAEKARRWEAIVTAGDNASDDNIRALIASGWLWQSETGRWQAILDRRAEDRAEKARREKSAQEQQEFGRCAWSALGGLKPTKGE